MGKNLLPVIIIIGVVIIGFVFFLFFRQTRPQTTTPVNHEPAITENITESTGQVNSGIIVPENVIKECSSQYFETIDGVTQDCSEFNDGPVCGYYKEIKDDQENTRMLQFDNECYACQFFGESGEKISAGITMINLGFEKKACSQGLR